MTLELPARCHILSLGSQELSLSIMTPLHHQFGFLLCKMTTNAKRAQSRLSFSHHLSNPQHTVSAQ